MERVLVPEPLERVRFAPYGDVIEAGDHAENWLINENYTRRYDDLAKVDVLAAGGRPLVNIFRSRPLPGPIQIRVMERHPLSSQAFMPLDRRPWLVVVAAPGEFRRASVRAFLAGPGQGVNYHRGTWHHYCLALAAASEFLVIDRGGPGANCDEVELDIPYTVSVDGGAR